MDGRTLFDSSAYIDREKAGRHLNQDWAKTTLRRYLTYVATEGKPFLSVISVAEILKGLYRDIDSMKAEDFHRKAPNAFQFLDANGSIAFLAAEIMAKLDAKELRIGIADSLIAGTAIHNDMTLVTSNTRHFLRVTEAGYPLRLDNWRNP